MEVPSLTMNDGHNIPQIALGLWQVRDETEFNTAFDAAVAAGYRHFDSAQYYQNEQFLGASIKRAGLAREDVFITTKIANDNFGYDRAKQTFEESLTKLQTDYVDLLLLHFPVTGVRQESWEALEELQADGKVTSIGVSNYTVKHLEEMQAYAKVTPAVNQVELHVYLQQPELVKYCEDHGILVEAYSPLAHAKLGADDLVLTAIASKHGKTYAQVMLRFLLQLGTVILPKSVTPSRIQENMEVFDFELDADDMAQLRTLDGNQRTAWDPTDVE